MSSREDVARGLKYIMGNGKKISSTERCLAW
jgi:hypothetical protein